MPVTGLEPRAPEKGTALYRHFGDSRAGLFSVHALLLQVMHPVVSAGVAEHSNFRNEAWKRLYETVMSLATWVYAGQEGATLEANRLREMHTRIVGFHEETGRYTALSPEPWAWVYATLLKGSIDAQQYFGRRIKPDVLEELYQQARQLGALMGIRPQDFPETWAGFEKYFANMQQTKLHRTQSSDDVVWFIRHVARPTPLGWVPLFIWRPIMWFPSWLALLITAGTLPSKLRDELGLKWGPGRARTLAVFRGIIRALNFLVPQRLQVLPAVMIGKINLGLLKEKIAREAEHKDMKARGQWNENHHYAASPILKIKCLPILTTVDLPGLTISRMPDLAMKQARIVRHVPDAVVPSTHPRPFAPTSAAPPAARIEMPPPAPARTPRLEPLTPPAPAPRVGMAPQPVPDFWAERAADAPRAPRHAAPEPEATPEAAAPSLGGVVKGVADFGAELGAAFWRGANSTRPAATEKDETKPD